MSGSLSEVHASKSMGGCVADDVETNESECQNHPCHHLGGQPGGNWLASPCTQPMTAKKA